MNYNVGNVNGVIYVKEARLCAMSAIEAGNVTWM